MNDAVRCFRRSSLPCLIVIAFAWTPACGRKGAPLPPLRPIPARLEDLSARRIDNRIELRFTVPTANADRSTPAAVERYDIFMSSTAAGVAAPAAADLEQTRNLHRQITIARPVQEPAAAPPKGGASTKSGASGAPGLKPRPPSALLPPAIAADGSTLRAAPGDAVLVIDTLVNQPQAATLHYLVVGIAGRRRQPSAVVSVPVAATPAPPHDLEFTYDEKTLKLTWQPGDANEKFRMYDVASATETPAAPTAGPPTPLSALLSTAEFTAPVVFDKERCVAIRSAQVTGVVSLESAPVAKCVTPVDTFPPPPPTNLRAFPGTGSVTLTWDGVSVADLAGYMVFRAEGTGEKLQPLSEVLTDTTFTDSKAAPGVTYWYAVIAMDKSKNPSEQSNRVQSTAR